MELIKINTYKDLPPYGEDVLVIGTDFKQYGKIAYHICQMDDLEDGIDFKEKGTFYWLTENGTKIENVEYYAILPKLK